VLNDAELKSLNGMFAKPTLNESLDIASRGDPDIIAESNLTPIDGRVYKSNKPEIERRKLIAEINVPELEKSHPNTSTWLTDPKNSSVAIDDLDILKGMEDTLKEPERGFWNNAARGGLDTVNSVTGNLIEVMGNVSEDFDDFMVNSAGMPNPGIMIGDDGISWTWDMPVETPSILTHVGKAVSEGKAFDYQPGFTWEKLKGDVTPTNLAGYIAEQGIQSLPHMLAAIYTLPAYVASRTEEIAESRVTNDQREDVTWADLATSLIPATIVALTERLGAKFTFGVGKAVGIKGAMKATGVAAAVEGGTEFIQEGIEYLGETAGTKKKLSATEMLDRQFAGLVAGAGMGGGIRATTATVEAVTNKTNQQIITDEQTTQEQATIDQVISYAQSSATNKRAAGQFEDFIKTVGDRDVLIPNDVAMDMENAPDYIIEQVNELGADIAIPMSKFVSEIAKNDEWMALLRPHIKLSEGTQTQAELEEGDRGEIQSLLDKVAKEKEVVTESEKIYQDVKEQIVSTGMQSEQTARHSAAIYPAAVATYVEKARLMGHDVKPQEVYEMMGFSTGKGKVEAEAVTARPKIPDDVEIQMDLESTEISDLVPESFNAKKIYDSINNRIDNYQSLLDGMPDNDVRKSDVQKRIAGLESDKANILNKTKETEKRATPDDKARDRRKSSKARDLYADMSQEELINQILKHELTGIKGRKAFVVDVQTAPVVGSIDADSLKWINDNLSPDHGDALLQAVADAIESQTDAAYHISGDEFYVLGETQAEIETILKKVDEILSQAIIKATKPDGKVITLTGLNVTYGIGESKDVADQRLKAEKIAREGRGERTGRGEQPFSAVVRDAQGNEIKRGTSGTDVDPRIFGQPDTGTDRASIEFTDKNESIIRLTQASDLSSFLHESGHLFLEMESRFAKKFGQTKDQKVLLDWLEVESFEDLTTKEHEKFAETFEVYLREGKAPSLKLRDTFAAFARWLTNIYRTLTDPRLANADLTPEIRQYMDRMLATEAEIEQAMANPAYDQFFKSKEQAGMTDAEWDKYQSQVNKAKNTATIDLNQKVIDELRKRKTKEWNDEREPLIDEEKARLEKLPSYQVLDAALEMPMDRGSLKELGNITSIPPQLRNRTVEKDGADPQAVAELYGFNSVKEMVSEITSQPTLKIAAHNAAESRMVEKYGDMLNDGRIELEARESIHNEEQAKVVIQEIRALSRKKSPINREYLKAEAKKLIGSMKYKEIKPNKFYHAEIRAAKKAVTSTDDQEILTAKTQQIANHYLYREAVTARDQMNKQRKQVKGFETREYTPKSVDPSYAQNIRMLAKSYNMRQGDARKSLDVERVVSWMITQMDDPNNYVDLSIFDPNIIEMIVARQDGKPVDYVLPEFNDLTANELKGLTDQLRHMRFVGGKLSDTAKNELMVKRQEAAESIDKFAKKKIAPRHEVTTTERIKDSFLEFGYSHRRIGGIFETLDGFKEDGPMAQEYEKITDASNKELELTDLMADSMNAAFKGVTKQINKFKKETITKADGVDFTLSHRARFTLALNWGNQGNRDAVLEGLNAKFPDAYTANDITTMLSTMSRPELEALNKIWAAKDALWPEMSKVEVNRKGVAPAKVEALPFTVNDVKLTGGHYRLHYLKDPADSARTEITVDRAQNKSIKIGTASSMNERVGSGGRQVDLELGHLFQDIQEEIHYISYAELSDHLNSMFKGVNNEIVTSIMKGHGEPYYNNLTNTLSTLTQPENPAQGLWKGLKFVRSNLTYGFLAGSLRNIVQQPIAVTNSISQLGGINVLKGSFEFYRNPRENWDKISEASAFMRNRTALVNREAREQLLKIDSVHPALGKMKTMAFAPQTFMDSLIAYPTWMGALSKYKKDHPNASEKKAILYADEMVAKTIGSGLSKDVGSILNKSEAEKQITFMGTFFNLTWNLHVENAQLLKNGDINPMEYARRLGWMAIAPALLAMWVLDDIPEDEEKILPHALKEIAYYNMSSLFLVRDLASGMDGFNPSIPGLKFVDGTIRVSKEMQGLMTGDDELDANTVASILRGLQPLAPLPGSGQVARTLEGMSDPEQGVWGSLVEGKERNK